MAMKPWVTAADEASCLALALWPFEAPIYHASLHPLGASLAAHVMQGQPVHIR